MTIIRGLVAIMLLMILAGIVSCDKLSMKGPQKYKVDLTNALLRITDAIDGEGEVKESYITKLENLLAKYEEEFSSKGSHQESKKVVDKLKEAAADENNRFKLLKEAQHMIFSIQEMLKTEVQS